MATDPTLDLESALAKPYGFADFERDVSTMQPRLIDTWVIPPLMLWFAVSARSMHRWPRRMLFSAGVYMIYRNWLNYKTGVQQLAELAKLQKPGAV